MLIGLRLEIERRRAERGRVQPRPGLGRGDRFAEEVRRRRGPARRGQRAPLESFAVEDVGVAIAGEPRRRQAVVLNPEPHAVLRGPLVHRHEEPLFEQLGERPAVVAPDRVGAFAGAELGDRQQRPQIVAAPLLELLRADRPSSRRRRPRGCRRTRSRCCPARPPPAACRPPRADASRSPRGCSDRARSLRRRPPHASRSGRSGRRSRTARRAGPRPAAADRTALGNRPARERMPDRLPAPSRAR